MLVQNTEFGGVQKRHYTRENPHQFTTVDAFYVFLCMVYLADPF